MRQFFHELDALRAKLLAMAALVEEAVRRSVRVVLDHDEVEGRRVLDLEARVNLAEMETDEIATRLLALQQPVAKDLRFITAAIKINSDLERMGDLAVNIVRNSLELSSAPDVNDTPELPELARRVEEMVHHTIEALAEADETKAREVLAADDAVDALRTRMYKRLVRSIEKDATAASRNVKLIFVAHSLERIADHSTNVAESVLFFVHGVEVRHRVEILEGGDG